MPPKPTNRTPEPLVEIRAELGAYGLWLEIEHTPGDWHAVFLPTRTVRRLVAALLADRQQTLAAIDRSHGRRPGDHPGGGKRGEEQAGSGARIALGSDHAPSLHHHKE